LHDISNRSGSLVGILTSTLTLILMYRWSSIRTRPA
jgi:hypothetical protein